MTSTPLPSARTAADVLAHFATLQKEHHNSDPLSSPSFAAFLDSLCTLPPTRSLFNIPRAHPYAATSPDCLYFTGNSLGLQPKLAVEYVGEEMNKWGRLGVEGHFNGERPWLNVDEPCLPLLREVVGAAEDSEVGVMNTLSVNLHLLLTAFYQPTSSRFRILMEEAAFCSDHHVIRSQLALHGQKVDDALIQLRPREGDTHIRTEDIVAAIRDAGESLAVVMLPGVQFYTGQLFEMDRITAAAHDVGAYAGFDLAHAAGNASLALHDWGVDFAAWCSYKYLNSGPGAISGIFFHSKHHQRTDLPKLSGWWGQTPEVRFRMKPEHQPIIGAQSFQQSNPPVLPTVCLLAALRIFQQAGGMAALRAKSVQLTAYLELLLSPLLSSLDLQLLTPTSLHERGCQLSVRLPMPVRGVLRRLEVAGVLCDGREPNVIRISPAPLYNTFSDICSMVALLETALKEERDSIAAAKQETGSAVNGSKSATNGTNGH